MTRRPRDYSLLSGLVIAAFIIGILLMYLWNKPLGPQLMLPTRTAGTTGERSPLALPKGPDTASLHDPWQGSSGGAFPDATPRAYAPGEPVCGGPELMTILLIGSDYRGDGYLYGLADAIRIVRIDFTVPSVTVLDFPRDLWVEIPGIADHYGLTHGKLNQAYFYGSEGMGYYDGPGEGPGLLARTLDLNFNVQVDHYMTLNMGTLAEAVDTVGGVEITFDTWSDLNAVVGPTYEHLQFPPGTYHFNGELAVHLVTARKPSTFQRTIYQNMLIFALRDKLLATEMLPVLPALAIRFIDDTQTDLSLDDISELVCTAKMVTEENIHIVSFPEELFTPSTAFDSYRKANTYIDAADFEVLRAYSEQFMAGVWP